MPTSRLRRKRAKSFSPRKRINKGTLMFALSIQAVLLIFTVFVIVLDAPDPEAPQFEGRQSVAKTEEPFLQQRELERFMKRVSKPKLMERLSVDALLPDSLPALPELPKDAFAFDGGDEFMLEDAQSMLESSGLLSGGASLGGASSAAEFFGVQDSGRRIVIIVNTSASVVRKASNRGVTIEAIQAEVAKMIEGLESGTLFGVVQFSQGTRTFAPYLAPAIARNKEAARNWVKEELKGNPPVTDPELLGHEGAFLAALGMEPDLIFLVTDGVLNKRIRENGKYKYPEIPYGVLIETIEDAMDDRALRTRIHAIGFELREKDLRGLNGLTRKFGGTVREF